jgi:hypothetical protein
MTRWMHLFFTLALLLPLQAWQKYTGPRPPKPDIPYLLHGSALLETEVKEAKEEQRKDENAAAIPGTASPVKTPLPEPIFLFLSEKIAPEKLEMYKLTVTKDGRREVAFPAAGKKKKDGPRPIHLSTSKLDPGLYRIEASEVLELGEYCLSPSGANTVFCFQVY